jgi:hypothetical protein
MPKEIIRVRCPACGMMPTLDNLAYTDKEKPAEVRIFIQTLGGKAKAPPLEEGTYKKRKRGSAPGLMEYTDVTDQYPDQVKEMQAFFDKRIKLYQEGKK